MTDKDAIRERVWDHLEQEGLARFPFPPHGRIPNFEGAGEAANRLEAEHCWEEATTLKCNPDAPQLPVRRQALRAGKTIYMAVPRLAAEQCFLELDPAELEDVDSAPTVSNVESVGTPRAPADLPTIDLVVVGSVAVTSDGARIGKGEGFSDLEFALLAESGRVGPDTTVASTVHDVQVPDEEVSVAPHDVPLDLICTPTRTIRTETAHARPAGIDWTLLSADRIEEMPVLEARSHTTSDTN